MEFETDDHAFKLCTKFAQFQAKLETVEDSCEFLTITGIDNNVADLTNGSNTDNFNIKQNNFFLALEDLRMKGLKITVGPLLPWKKHSVETKRTAVC